MGGDVEKNSHFNDERILEKKVADEIKFEVPNWAGPPPLGFHLDVTKNDKLIQKLMIDEKRSYFFGRNRQLCDFIVDHASCSRVHAVLLYHRLLHRFFLIDLGSSHGTFIGKTRLESDRPQMLDLANVFHFGASTRRYSLRAKLGVDVHFDGQNCGAFGLRNHDDQLQNVTEYNTAVNRRSSTMTVNDDAGQKRKRSHVKHVDFVDEDVIINLEDVDPTVGRFRNMITTAVIPNKRAHSSADMADLFVDLTVPSHPPNHRTTRQRPPSSRHHNLVSPFGAQLGFVLPNPAPDIQLYSSTFPPVAHPHLGMDNWGQPTRETPDEPKKKKYAKEAWPGKKTGPHMLV